MNEWMKIFNLLWVRYKLASKIIFLEQICCAKIHDINYLKDLRISTLYKYVYSWFLERSKFDFFFCFPYSFTIEKFLFSSFLVPWKFVKSTCYFKQCNPVRNSSPQEDYFSPSVIWPSLNIKNLCESK